MVVCLRRAILPCPPVCRTCRPAPAGTPSPTPDFPFFVLHRRRKLDVFARGLKHGPTHSGHASTVSYGTLLLLYLLPAARFEIRTPPYHHQNIAFYAYAARRHSLPLCGLLSELAGASAPGAFSMPPTEGVQMRRAGLFVQPGTAGLAGWTARTLHILKHYTLFTFTPPRRAMPFLLPSFPIHAHTCRFPSAFSRTFPAFCALLPTTNLSGMVPAAMVRHRTAAYRRRARLPRV